jgi:hypothetical protein
MRTLTIVDALRDPKLFGALLAFRDLSTWARWLVFLKATYGLALDEPEAAVFRQHTGRSTYAPPPGGWQEVVAVVGRQSGKSRIAGTVVGYEAARAQLHAAEADAQRQVIPLRRQQAQGGLAKN